MDEDSETFNEILIQDNGGLGNNLNFSWALGNQMILSSGLAEKNDDQLSQVSPNGSIMHHVFWNTNMHTSEARKLLNESHQIFLEVQNYNKSVKENLDQTQFVKFSRKYRSVLRACVLELKVRFEEEAEENIELEQHMQLYRMMEIIWNLCEILFIESPPSGVILLRLVEWCRWHFTRPDELVEECMQNEFPHSHQEYWNAIKCLVLQGRTEDARNMLKLHPEYQTQAYDAYYSIDELLRKMPLFSYYQGQSVTEFDMKWHHWQEECHRRLTSGDFETQDQLRDICLILCGDEDVFRHTYELQGSWYQALVSTLLYTQPTVSMNELQHHSKLTIDMFGGRSQLGAFDDILLAAYELDPYQVIKKCSQQLSSWWLATHLADLFYHCGLLSHKKLDFGTDLREFLLLEYASSLMSHDSLWPVTVGYLSACSGNGKQYLSLFIQKIPLTSERKASKLLRLCQEYSLHAEFLSICRQMSMKNMKSNRLGATLVWCLKANDSAFAMCIAEKLLLDYRKTGKFLHIDLLDHLGPSILLSERLTFLGKYKDFHKLVGEGFFKDAAALLLNLITSNIAPKEFWPSLLIDSLPLLQHSEMVYNAGDTVKLLNCLNTLDQADNLQEGMNAEEIELQRNKLELLRLALARNLSRAIVAVN